MVPRNCWSRRQSRATEIGDCNLNGHGHDVPISLWAGRVLCRLHIVYSLTVFMSVSADQISCSWRYILTGRRSCFERLLIKAHS